MSKHAPQRFLGELAALVGGYGFLEELQGHTKGDLPFFKVSDMNSPGNELRLHAARNYVSARTARSMGWKPLPAGTVVFAKVGAGLLQNRRRVLLADALIDNNMMGAIPGPDVFGPFLLRWLQRTDFGRFVLPGVLPSVNQAQLAALPIELPDAQEQRQIAKVLDAIDEAVWAAERIAAKLELVRQGITEQELRTISSLAAVRPLRQAADVSGGVVLSGKRAVASSVRLPYLRVANVQDGYVDTSEMRTVAVNAAEVERYRLRKGDVLMNEGGDFDKLGRGAVWDGRIDPCLHQNHVFRVRCDEAVVMPEYLALYSASRTGKRYFVNSSKQTTNLASINKTQIELMPVPVPPLGVQHRLVQLVSAADARLASERERLTKLINLRDGLAADLLSGRVRAVPA